MENARENEKASNIKYTYHRGILLSKLRTLNIRWAGNFIQCRNVDRQTPGSRFGQCTVGICTFEETNFRKVQKPTPTCFTLEIILTPT